MNVPKPKIPIPSFLPHLLDFTRFGDDFKTEVEVKFEVEFEVKVEFEFKFEFCFKNGGVDEWDLAWRAVEEKRREKEKEERQKVLNPSQSGKNNDNEKSEREKKSDEKRGESEEDEDKDEAYEQYLIQRNLVHQRAADRLLSLCKSNKGFFFFSPPHLVH